MIEGALIIIKYVIIVSLVLLAMFHIVFEDEDKWDDE